MAADKKCPWDARHSGPLERHFTAAKGLVMISSSSHRSGEKVRRVLGCDPPEFLVWSEHKSAGHSYLLVPEAKAPALLEIKGVSRTRQNKPFFRRGRL